MEKIPVLDMPCVRIFSEISRLVWQPHDVETPEIKEDALTFFLEPHLHLQFQIERPRELLPALEQTDQLPNFRPERSLKLLARFIC